MKGEEKGFGGSHSDLLSFVDRLEFMLACMVGRVQREKNRKRGKVVLSGFGEVTYVCGWGGGGVCGETF